MGFKLHKEGKKTIPISFILILVIGGGGFFLLKDTTFRPFAFGLLAGGLALIAIILNFFRNPDIEIVENENHILAPCDGKVVVIEEVFDDVYFKGNVTQVSVFMSPLNVHVNRNPINGVLKVVKYLPGKYLMAFNPKSSSENEQTCLVAENDKVAVMYKQIAGFLARRIKWYVNEGDEVTQGAEFGFIKFGSRIDILFPTSCKVNVSLDEKVKAGRTAIATLGG